MLVRCVFVLDSWCCVLCVDVYHGLGRGTRCIPVISFVTFCFDFALLMAYMIRLCFIVIYSPRCEANSAWGMGCTERIPILHEGYKGGQPKTWTAGQ
jgi:hypothetical protein